MRHAPLSQGGSAIEDGASGGSKAAIRKPPLAPSSMALPS